MNELEEFKNMAMNARARAKRNYERNRAEILEKKKVAYRLAHPDPAPRGRPPLSKNLCDAASKTDSPPIIFFSV
ncbi:hypothetical protein C9890_0444 [Perkinsus sp. BL_2016]|nr:hypothetical protein C9890_0444 [Perkinsus sp. BL_2016]